jgi:hypothetical protein
MARHRSPRGRQHDRVSTISPSRPARAGSVKIGLVALATGALLVAGNALVGLGSGDHGSDSGGGQEATLAAPAQPVAPPPPPTTTHRRHGATSGSSTTSRASKPRTGSSASGDTELVSCTKRVSSAAGLTQALSSAGAGDKICATGDMGTSRLSISKGGTAGSPLRVVGSGSTVVKGITVSASNVLVSGFNVVGAKAPGVQLEGRNITLSHNKVGHTTGGDYDGIRFFGDNIKILNNTISDINPGGSKAHADCMQTYQNGTPASKNLVIDGNRCERISNMCLMAEGPGDIGDGGTGEGESSNWLFSNNYCDNNASQALMIEAVQNVTVKNNRIVGKVDKAFAFDVGSTGAKVLANKISPGIGYEVGMSSDSKRGYQGPAVGGEP